MYLDDFARLFCFSRTLSMYFSHFIAAVRSSHSKKTKKLTHKKRTIYAWIALIILIMDLKLAAKSKIKRKPPVKFISWNACNVSLVGSVDWPQNKQKNKMKKKNYGCIVNCLPWMRGSLISVLFLFSWAYVETNFHAAFVCACLQS